MNAWFGALVVLLPASLVSAQAATRPVRPATRPIFGEPVVYKKVDGRQLKLYVVKPKDWKPADTRPAIVMIHGGGWKGGGAWLHNAQAEHFAARGMVGVLVEYRLLGKGNNADLPVGACQDAKSAIRYVRAHAAELGIDPKRIAASGASAGGHLSAFAALVPGMDDPTDDPAVSARPDALLLISPALDVGPGSFFEKRFGDSYKAFSPVHHVAAGAPPTHIVIGDRDQYIPVPQIEQFRDAMLKHGNRCEAVFFEAQEHGLFTEPRQIAKTLLEQEKFLTSQKWLPLP